MTKPNEGPEMKDYVTRNARETPKAGFVRIVRDCWWVCLKGDPDALLFYQPKRGAKFGYPQCNKAKSLAASLAPKNTDVVFVPLAFVPVDLKDYV